MQIQHPTASLIARASTAQDDMTGDGTTSTVLIIGELLKQADIYVAEGLHPRLLTEGFDKARAKALEVMESMKIPITPNKESLTDVCRTSLRTKVYLKNFNKPTIIFMSESIFRSTKNWQMSLQMFVLMQFLLLNKVINQLIYIWSN